MSRSVRLAVVATVGILAAIAANFLGSSETVTSLIALSTALVLAEQFQLRPRNRAPLPLSFAVVVVLVRAAEPSQFLITVVVAYAVGIALRSTPRGVTTRFVLYAERLVEAIAAGLLFNVVIDVSGNGDTQAVVLGGLAAAAVVQVVIADVVTFVTEHRVAALRDRGADLALITSAMLMAVGYDGIDGAGRLGLWGPLLFSIPLLAAWYSFELVASTRRSFWQTVGALGRAPELAGLVRPGHAQRVSALAVSMGEDLDLTSTEVEQLETAALLHHLGAVCLDSPSVDSPLDASAVAEAGGSMLRGSEALAAAGDIVAAEPLLHRPPERPEATPALLAGQILKVASAFDELTDGRDEHATWALEAIYTGPLYVYDGRVVASLERVLERRGMLPARV